MNKRVPHKDPPLWNSIACVNKSFHIRDQQISIHFGLLNLQLTSNLVVLASSSKYSWASAGDTEGLINNLETTDLGFICIAGAIGFAKPNSGQVMNE